MTSPKSTGAIPAAFRKASPPPPVAAPPCGVVGAEAASRTFTSSTGTPTPPEPIAVAMTPGGTSTPFAVNSVGLDAPVG